jgi:transcriptional regulator with XRE-family HTH domain
LTLRHLDAYQDAPFGAPHGFRPPPLDVARVRARAKRAKADLGLSIQDLVMGSGLSRTAVLDLLNGRGRISNGRIDSWWALAWALGLTFGDLMGAADDGDHQSE